VLFTLGYAPALGPAMTSEQSADHWLFAPVAGPWVAMGLESDYASWPLAAAGMLQLGGASLLVAAFTHPRRNLGPANARLQPSLELTFR
jgi:hypothetical protein